MGLFENRVPPNPMVHHQYLPLVNGGGQDGLGLLKWRLDRRPDLETTIDQKRTSQNEGKYVTSP